MTRGPGWQCLDMGRRLERALHTVRLLRSLLVDVGDYEEMVLETLLEIVDSSMTYRSRSLTTVVLTSLRLAEIDVLCEVSGAGHRSHLATVLTRLLTDLPALSDTITQHYLSHIESSRHLATNSLVSPP